MEYVGFLPLHVEIIIAPEMNTDAVHRIIAVKEDKGLNEGMSFYIPSGDYECGELDTVYENEIVTQWVKENAYLLENRYNEGKNLRIHCPQE